MALKMVRRIVVLLVVVGCSAGTALEGAGLTAEQRAAIEEIVREEMAQQKIPGLSLALAVDGDLVYSEGFGLADVENDVAAQADTLYRTGSIAKPMTATAVLRLAEAGKLDLDTPIQQYCPAYPEKPWRVTPRRLLGHQGGVRHYNSGAEATSKEHYFTLEEAVEIFKDDDLLHEPGTRYRYTTFGYVLLGCAVEGASGKSYLEYLEEAVLRPAGMERTFADDVYRILPNRARGYVRLDEEDVARLPAAARNRVEVGAVYNASLHDTSMKIPGGGLVSTAEDLVRFALAHYHGRLVSVETRAAMWTRQKTRDGEETGYGLGWRVGEFGGRKAVTHGGAQAGVRTFLGLLPEEGLAVAVMGNLQGTNVARIAERVSQVLLAGE